MHVLVTGGTGFIGQALCRQLAGEGHALTVLTRHAQRAAPLLPAGARTVTALAQLQREAGVDAVVNLAGEPIADKRWSSARKRELETSRIALTRELVAWMRGASPRPRVLVSASAIGYYGDQGNNSVTEGSAPHDEYQHRLCRDWEREALAAREYGIRVAVLRIGLVVGSGGGFLQRMLPPFRLGLGGPIGSGRQWMSWIEREDLLAMIHLLLEREDLDGAFNATAPEPVSSRVFARTLGAVLRRPAFMPLPAFLLQLALGEMSQLLLTGQRVLPQRFTEQGFRFRHPQLESALRAALQ